MTQCQTTLVPSADCGCTCWLKLTVLRAIRASAELKHSLFSVIFTATFIPKNKIHRKYVHFFRPKNKRPTNKKMRFLAPKTKKKTKFGRPLVIVVVVVVVVFVVVVVGIVSRWPIPRHGRWHSVVICWRVVRRQKRSAVTCTLLSVS